MVITGANGNARRRVESVGRMSEYMGAVPDDVSLGLAEIAADIAGASRASVVILMGDTEGSRVGALVADHHAADIAVQLRLIADDLEARHAAGLN